MVHLRGLALVLLACLSLVSLGACARPGDLVLGPPDLTGIDITRGPAPSYLNAIAVSAVTLGTDPGTPWTSQFGIPDIQGVLIQTLTAARLTSAGSGRFRLDTMLLTLQRPYAGFGMTVSATIAYRLTDTTAGVVVYERTLTTLGTATLNDAITNENRLRIADERAVRANLRQLVADIYGLPDPRLRLASSSPRT
jgi:hypothetical protein